MAEKYEQVYKCLEKYNIEDLKQDCTATLDQFKRYNLDGDDTLTRDEIYQFCIEKKKASAAKAKRMTDFIIKKYDIDNNDKVPFREFVKASLEDVIETHSKPNFDKFDKDKSGSIEAGELEVFLKNYGFVADDMKKLDKNSDGKVSFDEFLKLVEKDLDEAFHAAVKQ